MKKRFYITFLLCLMLGLTAALAACTPDDGGDGGGGNGGGTNPNSQYLDFQLLDESYSVGVSSSNRDKISGKVIIPATHEGLPVVEIYTNAFNLAFGITEIEIPDSVVRIKNGAFNQCGLQDYSYSGEVRGVYADKWLIGLEGNGGKLTIREDTVGIAEWVVQPSTVTDFIGFELPQQIKYINHQAFRNCGLGELTIPDSVLQIDGYAFSDCNITKIYLGTGLESIGADYWGGHAFSNLPQLNCIEIDGENQHFSSKDGILFNKAKTEIAVVPKAISGDIVLPDTLTKIGEEFAELTTTCHVTVPTSVTEINDAFRNCENLTITWDYVPIEGSIMNYSDFLNRVTHINFSAQITKEQFPNSNVMSRLFRLIDINVDGENQHFAKFSGILFDKALTEIIFVPKSLSGDVVLPETLLRLPVNTFTDCIGITSINIPASITHLGDGDIFRRGEDIFITWYYNGVSGSFYGNSALQNYRIDIIISDSINSIQSMAFKDFTKIRYMYIPTSLTYVTNAFTDCTIEEIRYAGTQEEWENGLGKLTNLANKTVIFDSPYVAS